MGGFVSKPIKTFLSKYTYNFQEQQMSLEIFKGSVKLENLILNEHEINNALKAAKVPFRLKFGVMKKFEINLSFLGTKLETMKVEDFIVILGPVIHENDKFDEKELRDMTKIVINNILNIESNNNNCMFLDPELFLKSFKDNKSQIEQPKKSESKDSSKSEKGPNIFGSEIIELVKGLLNCDIVIENFYLIYEDSFNFISSTTSLPTFQLITQFKNISFKSDQITKHTDKEGVFKGFMNIGAFLTKSGTWNVSDMAYWTFTTEFVKVSFSTGNPFFINDDSDNKLISQKNIAMVYSRFKETLSNYMNSSFDLLLLTGAVLDFILFYKEGSLVPIHAAFLFLNLGKINIKLESEKLSIILDVLFHIKTYSIVRNLDPVLTKFSFMTKDQLNKLASELGLVPNEKTALKKLNRIIFVEQLKTVIHLQRFNKLLKLGYDPQTAQLIVFRYYCLESQLYSLIFGEQLPELLKTELSSPKTNKKPEQGGDLDSTLKAFLKNDTSMIINKVHFHFRFHFDLIRDIIKKGAGIPENTLNIRNFSVDVFKPVGPLKVKVKLIFDKIGFSNYHKIASSTVSTSRSIFGKPSENKSQSSNSIEQVFEWAQTSLLVNFSLQEDQHSRLVYIFGVESIIGKVVIIYLSLIF